MLIFDVTNIMLCPSIYIYENNAVETKMGLTV